jgi:hypothetical protein
MRGLVSFRDLQPFVYGRHDRDRSAARRYPFARARASLAFRNNISPVVAIAIREREQPIECRPDDGSERDFVLGAELGFGHLDLKRFVDLARGMGIPGRDAARQVLGLVTERGRLKVPRPNALYEHLSRFPHDSRTGDTFGAADQPSEPAPHCEAPEYLNPLTRALFP